MRAGLVAVVVLLLGCVMSFASPAFPIPAHSTPVPSSSNPATSDSHDTPSTFEVAEFAVDPVNGLWTDTEIPLSDATLEAIRHATPATPEDIAAWNAEAGPEMQVQAVMEENEELESDADDADADADADADVDADAEREAKNEMDENEPADVQYDLEIAHGHHGRMLLIPHHSHSRFMMRRMILLLSRLISKLKARSPLARIELKLKIEPVTTPTPRPAPTPTPTPTLTPMPRRAAPDFRRPGPVAVRLIPSRESLQTRRILARCSMLLRMALKRLIKMKKIMINERMKKVRDRLRWLRSPRRGVILFRSNNITATGPSYSSTTMNRLEIEGEKNGTVTIIAPRVNATLNHSMIIVNRGTVILLNRSPNNTFAHSIPLSRWPRVRLFPL